MNVRGEIIEYGLPWRVLERVELRDEELLRLPTAGGGTTFRTS